MFAENEGQNKDEDDIDIDIRNKHENEEIYAKMIKFHGSNSQPTYHGYDVDQEYCLCGNKDPDNIIHYFYRHKNNNDDDNETEFIGVACKRCDEEYVIAEVLNPIADTEEVLTYGENLNLYDCTLYRKKKRKKQNDNDFGQNAYKTIDDVTELKEGDQFALDRVAYSHHGIVSHVDAQNQQFEGIHYRKVSGRATIIRETFTLANERRVHKIDYSNANISPDHPKLVLARAASKIGEHGYHLLQHNCEHFSSFCKTGIHASVQSNLYLQWIRDRFNHVINETNVKASFRYLYPITKWEALRSIKYVNTGIVAIVEGKTMIMEIIDLRQQRSNGEVTLVEFITLCMQRVIKGLIEVGVTLCASLAGAGVGKLISADGTFMNEELGIFIGGIAGGRIGSIPENTLSNMISRFLGNRIIPKLLAYDDCAVNDINDLELGDHIVFNPGMHHPRCHGIVTGYNNFSHMTLVRSTYSKGVIEEEIKFTPPVYRVLYKPGTAYDIHDVIIRARSRLGTDDYSLLTNNCKDFAFWCKRK